MSTGDIANETGRSARLVIVRVWDPLIRVFHWSLVGVIAYEMIAEAGTDAHEILGYVSLGLIAVRIVWGMFGTKHARFTDFVKSPAQTLAYLKSIATGHPRRYLGHNPAGGAMVIALLVTTLAVAGTGWAMTTDALWGQLWIEELHEGLANFMIILIVAHVIGIIVASIQHRENLIRSMITGDKSE